MLCTADLRVLTPGASNPVFGDMYGYPVPVNDMGMMHTSGMYPIESQLSSLHSSNFGPAPDFTVFPSDSFDDQPAPHFQAASQQAVNIRQVLFDFAQARRLLFRFDAYGAVSDVTLNVSGHSSSYWT